MAATSQLTGRWAGQQQAADLLLKVYAVAAAARCLCLLSVSQLQPCLQRRCGHGDADPDITCRRPPFLLFACP